MLLLKESEDGGRLEREKQGVWEQQSHHSREEEEEEDSRPDTLNSVKREQKVEVALETE